jgi:hypothetical protein
MAYGFVIFRAEATFLWESYCKPEA